MAYKRKYKQGKKITSFKQLLKALVEDKFIYSRNKIYHEGWVVSWPLRTVRSMLSSGNIRKAIKIKEI